MPVTTVTEPIRHSYSSRLLMNFHFFVGFDICAHSQYFCCCCCSPFLYLPPLIRLSIANSLSYLALLIHSFVSSDPWLCMHTSEGSHFRSFNDADQIISVHESSFCYVYTSYCTKWESLLIPVFCLRILFKYSSVCWMCFFFFFWFGCAFWKCTLYPVDEHRARLAMDRCYGVKANFVIAISNCG